MLPKEKRKIKETADGLMGKQKPEFDPQASYNEFLAGKMKGNTPLHRWNGSKLSFEADDNAWGDETDLRGPEGPQGKKGEKGDPGEDGYTPVKGVDYFDGDDGEKGKDGYTPIKGVDYFDGKDGKDGRDGIDGKDGDLKAVLEALRGLKGGDKIPLSSIADNEFLVKMGGRYGANPKKIDTGDLRWHGSGAGLTEVFHDLTLLGDGTSGNPLMVAPGISDTYKVKYSTTDTTPDFLDAKILAGMGITLTPGGIGGNETITISAPFMGGDVVGPASATDKALVRFDLATGKLIQDGLVTETDLGTLQNVNSTTYKLTPTITPAQGQIYWDIIAQTLAVNLDVLNGVNLQIGEEMFVRAFNNTGSTILNGKAVYLSGTNSISLAKANATNTSVVIGITTQDIANGSEGYITNYGVVHDVDTSAFTAGDELYLSPSLAGALTNVPPVSPNYSVKVGKVLLVNPTAGEILVTPSLPLSTDVAMLDNTNTIAPTQAAAKSYADTKMVNPMTTAGDIIVGGALGAPSRLPIGTSGQLLHGGAIPSYSAVIETDISLSDNTTNNASATKHGFLDKLPNNTTQFKRADGAWAVPASVAVPNGYVSESFAYLANTAHNIVHNFGAFPVVAAYDTSGFQVIPLSIQNTDTNTTAITFTAAGTYTIVLTVGSPPLSVITSVSADYSVLAGDYLVNVTASGKFITLPTAVGRIGKQFTIKNSSAGNIDVIFTGGQNADGYTDVTVPTKNAYTFTSDGSNFIIT